MTHPSLEIDKLHQVILHLQNQNELLLQRLAQKDREIEELKLENRQLRAENEELRAENRRLHKRISDLEEKLKTNSSNSSLSPSQDPYHRRKPQESSGRKQGAQLGHKPMFRKLADASEVTKFEERLPLHCHCGHEFSREDVVSSKVYQQVELPEIKPHISQYTVHTCLCMHCGRATKGALSDEENQTFGPRLKSFATLLVSELQISKRKIQSLLKALNITLCVGMVCKIHKQAGEMLCTSHEEIRKVVVGQKNVNGDETSWKLEGKLRYVWAMATSQATYLSAPQSRSSSSFESLYQCFSNVLTTDRYAVYNSHVGKRQICHAHLKRDLTAISERAGEDADLGQSLLGLHRDMFEKWHLFKAGKLSREQFQHSIESEIKTPFLAELVTGALGPYQEKTKGTCACILKSAKHFWTFAYEEGVEPTNNLAEREIRPLVMARKTSYGSTSKWGGEFTAKIFSVWLTVKKHSAKLWDFLKSIFICHARGDPAPSLLQFLQLNPST